MKSPITIKETNSDMKGFSIIELLIVTVILVTILGIISGIVSGIQTSYNTQSPRIEAVSNAGAALDTMSRLIRMAGNNPLNTTSFQAINPGTAVSGQYRTIRIRSDWQCGGCASGNPDGDTGDPFEDVTFSVSNGRLMKREQPADAAAVEFLSNVNALRFTYYNTDNALISNPEPVANQAQIARVDIELDTQTPNTPVMTFRTSVFLRGR